MQWTNKRQCSLICLMGLMTQMETFSSSFLHFSWIWSKELDDDGWFSSLLKVLPPSFSCYYGPSPARELWNMPACQKNLVSHYFAPWRTCYQQHQACCFAHDDHHKKILIQIVFFPSHSLISFAAELSQLCSNWIKSRKISELENNHTLEYQITVHNYKKYFFT